MEPLQRLPQQPLISPTGARLVLCNDDAGYPDSTCPSSPGRGRWLDNIASIDTKAFLQVSNYHHSDLLEQYPTWRWPSVVLMPEEYEVRVGEMSISGLRSQLEKFWGQGGIPGAVEGGYQDMWVPAWAPDGTDDPYQLSWYSSSAARLDPTIFSHWVNRECAKWLNYFIANNHTFGVVHAWFAAFLGITKQYLVAIAEFLAKAQAQDPTSGALMTAVSCLRFRMSFDVCIEGFDEVIDGIPSLPLNTRITTNKGGMQVINNSITRMVSRRIWDVCANTVIPATWFRGPPCPSLLGHQLLSPLGVKAISHAWVADGDLTFIVTEANQQLWPIPLPRGVLLEDVRGEMIRLGVRYAWLDVLCLRQQAQPALAKNPITPVSREVVERREKHRLEEWKVDVPTIGAVYSNPDKCGLYGGGPTVIFMSGLGHPFRAEGWASERHWLRRAWTLQETPRLSRCLIAGLPGGSNYRWRGDIDSGSLWPWNCKVDNDGQPLHSALNKAACYLSKGQRASKEISELTEPFANLDALLLAVHGRYSTNPIDKVCAIALPFQKRGFHNFKEVTFPIYDPSTPVSIAWEQLISTITSTKMKAGDFDLAAEYETLMHKKHRTLTYQEYKILTYNDLRQAKYTPTIQLLRLFPHPSKYHWFPSWTQVQQYPNVSVRDNGPDVVSEGMDCSLRIMSGRIYHDCSLYLIQPPTPEKKAVYCCTKDSKNAQLIATAPGIELNIDPRNKYVLVDISPDRSLWPESDERCQQTGIGHEHLPIWQESVVIICEKVETLAQPAADTAKVKVTKRSSVIMRYSLRRVTTLGWDCRPAAGGSLGSWLPFEPSLVHMRSVVCSARGGSNDVTLLRSQNVFCNPAAVAGLLSQEGWHKEWHRQCPAYEVYLV